MHKVAGAVNRIDNPGGAGGEYALGPSGRSLFCNEPVVGRSSAWENVPRTQDKVLQTASGPIKDKADTVKRFHHCFFGARRESIIGHLCFHLSAWHNLENTVIPQCRSFGKASGCELATQYKKYKSEKTWEADLMKRYLTLNFSLKARWSRTH